MISGFAPIARSDARVLILGTIPSERSLAEDRYYAHPQNAFWRIMERFFSEDQDLDYAARTEMLLEARVALWDVLHAAKRPGSLDSAIVSASVVPNDIAAFLQSHEAVEAVFFNGATAERLFNTHIAPTLPPDRRLLLARLPSSSPAHASLTFEDKVAAWRLVATTARGTGS